MMYRVKKVSFQANGSTINQLFELNRIGGEVWNACLDYAKDFYLTHKKWIGKSKLQTLTKGLFNMHSQSIQNVVHKYLESRDATHKARKKGYKNKYPYKKKRFFNTVWVDKGFTLQPDGTLFLSLGNGKRGCQRPKPLQVRVSKYEIERCFSSAGECLVKEVELVFDRTLKLCLTIDDGISEPEESKTGYIASIDQGEIHTISAVCENNESLIITGRKMRAIHQLRNKKVKELQKRLSQCKKGSRQWRKYNRAKRFVLSKSESQLKDTMHKTTKQFVDWCVKQEVNHVLIGDVEGVQRHTSGRKKKNKRKMRKKTSQKLSNWSFGKLKTYLTYKLREKGITIEAVNEAYTTQTCPVCGKRRKCSSRNYTCSCGYQKHRDIHGACNMLSQYKYCTFLEIKSNHPTYLRIA